MAGLVEQLQADAINQDIPVSTLLRKVKVAAVKLGLDDTLTWVQRELEGYETVSDLPDYRRSHGEIQYWNPYHGWQHINFRRPEVVNLVSQVVLFEPIVNYEEILKSDSGSFQLPLPPELVAEINNNLSMPVSKIINSISRGVIVKVVQRVRDLVLDWALELRRIGVTGEGVEFTVEERKTAEGASISIGTFNGSFNTGDAVGSHSKIEIKSRIEGNAQVFKDIESAVIAGVPEGDERDAILAANRNLSVAQDAASFNTGYQKLIQAAANHVTVLGPFLPALGTILAGS